MAIYCYMLHRRLPSQPSLSFLREIAAKGGVVLDARAEITVFPEPFAPFSEDIVRKTPIRERQMGSRLVSSLFEGDVVIVLDDEVLMLPRDVEVINSCGAVVIGWSVLPAAERTALEEADRASAERRWLLADAERRLDNMFLATTCGPWTQFDWTQMTAEECAAYEEAEWCLAPREHWSFAADEVLAAIEALGGALLPPDLMRRLRVEAENLGSDDTDGPDGILRRDSAGG